MWKIGYGLPATAEHLRSPNLGKRGCAAVAGDKKRRGGVAAWTAELPGATELNLVPAAAAFFLPSGSTGILSGS